MKKIFVLFALMALTVAAKAQHEEEESVIQPRVGMTFSTITGEDGAKMKPNVTYGFEYEYFVNDEFSLAAGLMFTNQGFKADNYLELPGSANVSVKMDSYYTTVPITINYYLFEGLAIKAGLQPAFRVKTNIKVDDVKKDLDDALELLFPNKEVELSKFDLSIPVGLSYEYENIVLDARYNINVTKVNKEGSKEQRSDLLMVTLGYKFAL